MSIPLVQNNEKDSINTSIIAIKKNLERINSILGLVDSGSDIDTSEFVKKSDIVDVVQSGNMNPVTSNAVVPVDTVTSGDMHSVTSNAVYNSLRTAIGGGQIKSFAGSQAITNSSLRTGTSGYIIFSIPNEISSADVIAVNFYTDSISASAGFQMTAIYEGGGKLYVNYYKPKNWDQSEITISYVVHYII